MEQLLKGIAYAPQIPNCQGQGGITIGYKLDSDVLLPVLPYWNCCESGINASIGLYVQTKQQREIIFKKSNALVFAMNRVMPYLGFNLFNNWQQ